ncbi:MAG: exodeoxyribonuclease III [Bacteroidota bacterium]
MKIVSYNVNGIRAALRKGLADWVSEHEFDVICLQETKALREQVDIKCLEDMGYQSVWHSAQKKGYSGVATFYKTPPTYTETTTGVALFEQEGRVLRTDFGDWTLLNCYFPSGSSGEERQAIKMQFLDDICEYIQNLRQECPNLIVVGDYNIAHTKMDIHDPIRNKKSSGFLPEERAWMDKWLELGFVDAFRHQHPEETAYSWWSYRANARANNKGWRIDYQCVSTPLKENIENAYHMPEAKHSDHCPICLEINLQDV